MTFKQLKSRRDFLRLGCRTISTLGAAAAFGQAGLVSAKAQTTNGYKALVCIFFFGGNDGNNLLIPADDSVSNHTYTMYKNVRQNLAIAQASLAPLSGSSFAVHPSLAPIAPLFANKQLALVANVGTLVQPLTRATYLAPPSQTLVPVNLFSHSDQQSEWQNSVPQGGVSTGWEGRLADRIFASATPTFPPSIGVGGSALQLVGQNQATQPAAINLSGFSLLAPAADPGTTALQNMLNLASGVTLIQGAQNSMNNAISVAKAVDAAVNSSTPVGTFPNSDIGSQLQQVAQIIQVQAKLGATRQIFFCSQGGFDTHSDQLPQQSQLMGNLAAALVAFNNAMNTLGQTNNVTVFTESEFSRTFQPNGNAGTDHAWGSHHIVMGGAVQGGQVYGTYPTLALSGPDDSGDRGNWVPTTATDQYGAALANWFGMQAADASYVFPNLAKFSNGPLKFI
ncbi:MAG TPA: DUF1501 domain-containing protein [Bryobacteraceae bacterium]|jgi:uncharacterized protein (DUF1501 family)